MRTEFIGQLTKLAKRDKRIFLMVGDLGYNVVEDFAKELPNQFINAGIAEQNMTGMAAGMAMSGNIVFTYSIANFPTFRALEQVRNDICYHNVNVKIIAVGAGFHYGPLGATHHATEDFAVMRSLPNMVVLAPGDPLEAEEAAKAMVKWQGPCYIRLGKAAQVYEKPPKFTIGKAITVRKGNNITLIATGGMVGDAIEAANILEKKNIHARVISMHTIKPLDAAIIKKAASETRAILTIEEHTIIGGLGGAVAEVLAEYPKKVPFKRIGIPDAFAQHIGDQQYLKEKYGLTSKHIAKQAMKII